MAMDSANKTTYMRRAIELAQNGMDKNAGGPFGALVVFKDKIIGEGFNSVTSTNDPTAHAEIIAIRNACQHLGSYQLVNCDLYTTCEPCPMCLGAIYWARISNIFIATNRTDASKAGFDDSSIYKEFSLAADERKIKTTVLLEKKAQELFQNWINKVDKIPY